MRLTNEKLAQTYDEERERLALLEAQIAEVDSRLGKLYAALETGEFRAGELAPRIKALFAPGKRNSSKPRVRWRNHFVTRP